MDGARVVRIEIDKDEDGKIDRWEYYGPDQKIEKIGFSRSNDGKEDAWSYNNPDGTIARIEVSTRRDGKVTRTEHYKKDVLVSAEEDTDEDGQIDKWETYDGERLASVAFDTQHRGKPDRRLIYGPGGTARLEIDPAGDGHFVAVDSTKTRNPNPKSQIPNPKSLIPCRDRSSRVRRTLLVSSCWFHSWPQSTPLPRRRMVVPILRGSGFGLARWP